MPAKLAIGPIVGKVTDTTARILLEVDRPVLGDVTCRLRENAAKGHSVERVLTLRKSEPRAFEFDKLRPETEYRIEIENVAWDGVGRVRTLPAQCTRMDLAIVSCNFPSRNGGVDLWADLRDKFVVPARVDVLLHMGDQVYGDSAFLDALGTLRGRSKPTKTQERNILETYRDLYRAAWGTQTSMREVLAQVSNLMIWDDHEIRDDWASRPSDRDPKSPEHCVGTLARRVYWEYQRQLWGDPPLVPGSEHHYHVWGSIGVLFLDLRGGRAFAHDPEVPYLGKAQWADVERCLALDGAFRDVRALVVVSSVPLGYLGVTLSSAAHRTLDDIQDHWSFAPYQPEQLRALRRFREWKERGAGSRELLLVGGDVHVGGYTEIRHEGELLFRQLISSPMTNRPPGGLLFEGLEAALSRDQPLAHGYFFRHSRLTNRRNYGVVNARIPNGGGAPTLDGSLVQAP